MAREKYYVEHFRKLPLSEVRRGLEAIGWLVKRDDEKAKIFTKGKQTLSILKIGKNEWKVEFFWGRHLSDSMGINNEEAAKILAAEFGMLKGIGR